MAPALSPRPRKARRLSGFTLVEMLAATAVLALLVLMVAALMRGASSAIASSRRHLDADSQARLVFDRMQIDFARMVRRPDVYFQFLKQTGNDQFTFFSETPGFFSGNTAPASQSNLSLVGYRFSPLFQLQRLGQGCAWTDMAFSPGTAPALDSASFHILGSSVFRMEAAFLIRTGDSSFLITGTPPAPGTQAVSALCAVMVAIAVFDSDSRKIVPAASYPSLVAALPDFTGDQAISLDGAASPGSAAVDPILTSWHAAVASAGFAQSARIPPAAARQVRLYQRIFSLR